MKFKPKKRYNEGDTRIRKKFLLFPRVINHETRWLETAYWKEQYKHDQFNLIPNDWTPLHWID